MLNGSLGMGFIFSARDLASAKIMQLERRFSSLDERVTGGTERMTSSFRRLGIGLGIFTVGAAAVAGAFGLANAAGNFEQSIAAVAAVSGATTDELELLKNAAIDAGVATEFSPTEASAGLRELAQAGYNAQESISLLRPALDLAAGSLGELTPQTAAGLAAQAMKAFGISIDDASISVDRMLQAVNVFALSANELPLALGTASRGAQSLHQSLSETLIALGLIKNVIPGVERASTAASVAMERLADPRVQRELSGIGVAVADNQGNFRQFLDVLGDMAPALDRMSEAQRSAFLLKAFGREALGGVNAILTQVTTGIRTNTGETLNGAEAVAYLRKQFEQAGGTAATFADKMLNTFAGQKQLLRGSMETLAIVLGEPFAQVFKPVVTTVVGTVNALLGVFRSMPMGVKKAFASFVVAAGAIAAFIGAVIAAKASIGILSIGLKALGVSLSGIMSSLLPAILIVGLLSAAVAGFRIAFEKNLGGIGDFAKRTWENVRLFFNGLMQLFEQGGFFGAVQTELAKAENQGLKRFLISVYQIGYRISQIWEGFKDGFTRSIEAARPVFEDLVAAFTELGNEIASVFSGLTGGAASLPSADFRSFGEIAGAAIASIVKGITKLIAIVTRVTSGIVSGIRSMMEYIGPAFATIGGAIDDLKQTWADLMGNTNDASSAAESSTESWRSVGETIGQVIGGIVTFIGLVIAGLIKVVDTVLWVVGGIKDIFVTVGTAIGEGLGAAVWFITDDIPNALSDAWDRITGFFSSIGAFFSEVASSIASVFRGIVDAVGGFFGKVFGFFERIRDVVLGVIDRIRSVLTGLFDKLPSWMIPDSVIQLKQVTQTISENRAEGSTASSTALQTMPAISDTKGRAAEMSYFEAGLQSIERDRTKRAAETPPFTVNVQVDGETIARASNRASADSASRGFSPVPVY